MFKRRKEGRTYNLPLVDRNNKLTLNFLTSGASFRPGSPMADALYLMTSQDLRTNVIFGTVRRQFRR